MNFIFIGSCRKKTDENDTYAEAKWISLDFISSVDCAENGDIEAIDGWRLNWHEKRVRNPDAYAARTTPHIMVSPQAYPLPLLLVAISGEENEKAKARLQLAELSRANWQLATGKQF